MAKRRTLTTQEESLQRLIRNAELKIVALKGMVDTAERIVSAQSLEIGDPDSPQIIKVSGGGGGLDLGSDGSSWQVVDGLTEEVSHTGDTVETTLYTAVVRGNKMGPNGIVRVSSAWDFAASAKGYIYWGQTIYPNNCFGYYANAGNQFLLDSCILPVWNKGNTGAQGSRSATVRMHANGWGLTVANAMTEDTTADVSIYFRVDNALAGDTSHLHMAMVEVLHRD